MTRRIFHFPEVNPNMPNAKVLSEKQAVVAALTEQLLALMAAEQTVEDGVDIVSSVHRLCQNGQNSGTSATVKAKVMRFSGRPTRVKS